MSRDRLLFRWMGTIHQQYGTPHRAIALQAVWAIVLVLTGTYRALFTRVVYTEWIFFALMAVGLVLLRRRPGYAPRFRVPGHPLIRSCSSSRRCTSCSIRLSRIRGRV